jgi:hypothetical protein
MFNEEDNY